MSDAQRRPNRQLHLFLSVQSFAYRSGLLLVPLTALTPAHAYDVNDKLSISGVGAAVVQCQEVNNSGNARDVCRDGFPFQPEITLNGDGNNTFFAKFGFAADNGLNPVSPFALAPWAADLEDDVKNINGRNRDYLLTAWYRHRIEHGKTVLAFTGGIIDATDYLDDNAYANDEYGQFMNEAFVNAPTAFLPSYDKGGVVELDRGPWSFRALVMQVGENDDGRGYTFYGAQAARAVTTRFGEGTYRVVLGRTNDRFLNPAGTKSKALSQVTFSADQQISPSVGVFVRIGHQDDDAAVTYSTLYSGGLNITGNRWRRPDDTIGIGVAHLDGGNGEVKSSDVVEVYYRAAINDHIAVTGDIQFIEDEIDTGRNVRGTIIGLRVTKEF